MDCQLGEVLKDKKCLPCNQKLQYYSVKKNSTLCMSIDEKTMEKMDRGLIYLKPGFWRPYFSNTEIEFCQPNNNCLGGFNYGDRLCNVGHLGAICSECDLFMEKHSYRYYKNEWGICYQCDITVMDIIIQVISFIMQIQLYFSSAGLIFTSILTYRRLARQNIILMAVQRIRILKQDVVGVYFSLLLEYISNLFNVSRNQVLLLMSVNINIDFVTNTSFSFINLIDCTLSQYFDQDYWIYIRLAVIVISHIYIFQIYILIMQLYLRFRRQKYQYLLISVSLIILYQTNVLGFFNQLLLLLVPIKFSGQNYIQSYKSLSYDSALHSQMIQQLILPLVSIIVFVIPIILYSKLKSSQKFTTSFTYLKFLYKNSPDSQDIIQRSFRFILIIQIHSIQREQMIRLIILGITLQLQYMYFRNNQPYHLTNLNYRYLQFLLWFNIQIMINCLIEYTYSTPLQYILTTIFYMILTYLLLINSYYFAKQFIREHFIFIDKCRKIVSRFIGAPLQLEQYRLAQINRFYDLIRNDIYSRRLSRLNIKIMEIEMINSINS